MQQAAGPSTRRRGGQPGNLNALKHGFYSGRMLQSELNDLHSMAVHGLDEEVALMRVMMRKVIESAEEGDALDRWLLALDKLGLAASRLAMLLRTQKTLSVGEDDLTLREALADAVKNLGVARLADDPSGEEGEEGEDEENEDEEDDPGTGGEAGEA